MDVSFTAKPDRLPVNAYIQCGSINNLSLSHPKIIVYFRRESGAPSNTSAPPNKLNWIDLRVEMDSFLGESIALEAISVLLAFIVIFTSQINLVLVILNCSWFNHYHDHKCDIGFGYHTIIFGLKNDRTSGNC